MPEPAAPFTVAALERCEADVAAVERALADLESGSFGRCDACGAEIEPDALAADLFARRCGRHRSGDVHAGDVHAGDVQVPPGR